MPQTKTAKKSLRSSLRKRAQNLFWKKQVDDLKRKIRKSLEQKDKKTLELFSLYCQVLDKSAKRNVIHKNTAARYKSRTMKKMIAVFGKNLKLPKVKTAAIPKKGSAIKAKKKSIKPKKIKNKTKSATKKAKKSKTS